MANAQFDAEVARLERSLAATRTDDIGSMRTAGIYAGEFECTEVERNFRLVTYIATALGLSSTASRDVSQEFAEP